METLSVDDAIARLIAELRTTALFATCAMRQSVALTLARTGDTNEEAWVKGRELTCAMLRDVIASAPEGMCEILKATLSNLESGAIDQEPPPGLRIVRTDDDHRGT